MLCGATYPTVRVPSPELIDAICGADGALGTMETTRDTELAAANAESPFCEISTVHDPMARGVKIPVEFTAHTDPPCVTVNVTGRPLDADAFSVKSGVPNSTIAG